MTANDREQRYVQKLLHWLEQVDGWRGRIDTKGPRSGDRSGAAEGRQRPDRAVSARARHLARHQPRRRPPAVEIPFSLIEQVTQPGQVRGVEPYRSGLIAEDLHLVLAV